MSLLLANLVALLAAGLTCLVLRRYFIFVSGPQKTNAPFIREFNFLTGSKNIIFANKKILAVNAHERHEELGDTFGCYFGNNMQFITRDPDLVYKIWVSDFQQHRNRYYADSLSPYMRASLLEARDHKWQTSRRAVGSVLKASKLKMDNVETAIDQTVVEMLESLDKRLGGARASDGDTVQDVYQINKNFFMQSLLKIVYDTHDLVDFHKEQNEVAEEMYKFINVNYEFVARMCFLIPILTNLVRPLLGFTQHGKYMGRLYEKINRILNKTLNAAKQQASGATQTGAPAGPATPTGRLTTIHSLINAYRSGELSLEQLKGNAFFLMLAGFATSVDTMSAFMFELARNPAVQEKLRADLLQYGDESRYMEQCINETLRLYPGALTNRDLGAHVHYKDMRLVKGACLNLNIYSIHRDPRYWGEDAHLWRPERFEPTRVAKFHPAQFVPFGLGPRNCVGYHVARLELSKFAIQFVLKYKLEPCAQTQKELQFVPLGALPFALPIEPPVYLRVTPATASR